VVAFARDALASYKVPRIVELRPDGTFPVTSTGKVSRRELTREMTATHAKAG
jgi:acyl-CoA synthetase (AMP-forming)/AMP-acid ligase II